MFGGLEKNTYFCRQEKKKGRKMEKNTIQFSNKPGTFRDSIRAYREYREQKQIVVTFIKESMEEPVAKREVPAEFKKLRGMVNITEEYTAQDERLRSIMER